MRLPGFLLWQRLQGFEVPAEPRFDPASTAFFNDRIRAAESYVEYGSGGSTRAADRLGVSTVSVEGDRLFAEAVRKTFAWKAASASAPSTSV